MQGKDLANPIGTILAAAMMLKYSFDMDQESEEIENAVSKVLAAGYRTGDIMSPGKTQVGCQKWAIDRRGAVKRENNKGGYLLWQGR